MRKKNDYTRLYYDFESIANEEGEHIPILCIIQYQTTINSAFVEKIFSGRSCAVQFVVWLLRSDSLGRCVMENTTCIAHNNASYDSYFILNVLYGKNILPSVIMKGCKILKLQILGTNISFIDSYCFINVALRKLPDLFETEELRKGYFPHLFHTFETENYDGVIPEKHFFQTNNDDDEFNNWYKSKETSDYNLKNELIAYCSSDVLVLKEACEKFRTVLLNLTSIDPFQNDFTIASYCFHVFRKLFLKPGEIGIVPSRGYRGSDRQSAKAIAFFNNVAETEHLELQTALTHEFKVGPYKIDAIDHQKKIIFEFNGCFFHSCPNCMNHNHRHPLYKSLTHGENYDRQRDRLQFIKDNMPEYEIRLIWECQFNLEIPISNFSLPINPREALYGGRCDVTRMLIETDNINVDEIHYADFCSLYPAMNKKKEYPKSQPLVIIKDFDISINAYFGVAKATLLPPKHMFHPVLPVRIYGKLMFPLCNACAIELRQETCNHSHNERVISGVWCTTEIYYAMEHGYNLIQFYEVWHYPKRFISGELFGNYIDLFLSLKQTASGYPKHITTEQQQTDFIQTFYDKEGILLKHTDIKNNPALRTVSKICLNSLWGRFAINTQRSTTKYVKTYEHFLGIMTDNSIDVTDIHLVSEDIVMMTTIPKKEFLSVNKLGSPVIASFVTCYARLHLLNILKKLDTRVIYTDTDSVFYTMKKGEKDLELGYFLGELVNELDQDKYITKFVATAPKTYCYVLNTGEEIAKNKGFILKGDTKKLFRYELYKKILTESTNIQTPSLQSIKRIKTTASLKNVHQSKHFKTTYDKRCISYPSYLTYPYGYIHQ